MSEIYRRVGDKLVEVLNISTKEKVGLAKPDDATIKILPDGTLYVTEDIYSAKVVSTPQITLSGFIAGASATISFTATSLLTSGVVVSFLVSVPALGVDTTVVANDNAGSIVVSVPADMADGDEIVVKVQATDELGNKSAVAIATGSVTKAVIKTPSNVKIASASSANVVIMPLDLSVQADAFGMASGEADFVQAVVKFYDSTFANVLASKEFAAQGPWEFTASELANITANGNYGVGVTYYGQQDGATSQLVSQEGRYNFAVQLVTINTPTLTSPVANAEILKTGSLIMTSSAFATTPADAGAEHTLSDWKVTSDAAGNVPVLEALNSTDLTSHTFADLSSLADNTTYYCWVRHHGTL